MKKIYTFMLDDDEVPSVSKRNTIQLIVYFLYNLICSYEKSENKEVLVKNSSLKYNSLIEMNINGKLTYNFESSYTNVDYRLYEPFIMLDDNSFGFTVYDGSISYNDIIELLNTAVCSLGLHDQYIVLEGCYSCKNKQDETKRFKEIDKIRQSIYYGRNPKLKKISAVRTLFPIGSAIRSMIR